MKKLMLFTAFVIVIGAGTFCLSSVQRIAASQSSTAALAFDADCPRFVEWMSSETLKSQMESDASEFYLSPTVKGCFLAELHARNDISDNDLARLSIMALGSSAPYFTPRPDIQAQFFEYLHDKGDKTIADQLADLYAEGRGVPQDSERAKHLYRERYISYFPAKSSGAACVGTFEKEITKIGSTATVNAIEKGQIDWVKSLCSKSDRELFDLAAWYADDKNAYHSSQIAEYIFYHLWQARHDPEAMRQYLEIRS